MVTGEGVSTKNEEKNRVLSEMASPLLQSAKKIGKARDFMSHRLVAIIEEGQKPRLLETTIHLTHPLLIHLANSPWSFFHFFHSLLLQTK